MDIIIYGCGGHGKVIADIIERCGEHRIAGFIDDTRVVTGTLWDYPIFTSISDPQLKNISAGIVAIGDNSIRVSVVNSIITHFTDFKFVTAIHPSTILGRGVKVGAGTVIMSGVSVNVDSAIGNHCIINTSSSVDHDCIVGDFASLAPGVILGGSVAIGRRTAVGLGAKVLHKITIGKDTVIGAGSVVTKSLPDGVVAYGVPCKPVRERNRNDCYL